MTSIHFHTDCDFFAGCENMIAILTNSDVMRNAYQLSLSYRHSREYQAGLDTRLRIGVEVIPVKLRIPGLAQNFSNKKLGRVMAALRASCYLIQLSAYSIQNCLVLYARLRKTRPDILHINNGGYPGALSCRLAVLVARLLNIKRIVMVVNNMAIPYNSYLRKIDYPLDRYVARNVSCFVTGSETAASQLKAVLCLPEFKLASIPNGIEIRRPSESALETLTRLQVDDENRLIFGMVGVMLPRKGHSILLEAIASLSANPIFQFESPLFLIEGDGELRADFETYSAEAGLNRYVKFVGTEQNIFNFYSVLDFLIYPSIVDEDFPNVISEALGMSVPVIAAKVAGATDQIQDRINGFLFGKGSATALASIILEICSRKGSYQNMAAEARKHYELHYTSEGAVQRYLKLYA